MPPAAKKDILREIRNSKNRFLAIMVLVALAVAFLSGLKATAPSMKGTGDNYLDAQRLMDVQIMSTLGITGEDIEALSAREGVAYAVGAYAIDAWVGDAVAKLYSITEEVNRLTVLEGRMPEAAYECVVDHKLLTALHMSVGDTLTILPGGDYEDGLRYEEFTIVGVARSPYYLAAERGSASIGSGSVQGYAYIPESAFDMEAYTIAYLLGEGALELTAFYGGYDDLIEGIIDSLEPFGEERAQLRYQSIIDEAMEEIEEAQRELDEAVAEAEKEIADAENELADARRELDEGWEEYEDGKRELESAYRDLAEGEQELSDAFHELLDGEEDFQDGLEEFREGRAEYESNLETLNESHAALTASQQQLDAAAAPLGLSGSFTEAEASGALAAAQGALASGIADCGTGIAGYQAQMTALDGEIAALETELSALTPDTEEYAAKAAELDEAKASRQAAADGIAQLKAQKAELEARQSGLSAINPSQLAQSSAELEAGWAQYNQGKSQMDAAKAELDEAEEEIEEGRDELDQGWQEYYDGCAELDEGWEDYYRGKAELPEALEELEEGEAEYADGVEELEETRLEAEEEIADAREKLADARREVADIEAGEWYILPRGYNPGYTGFGQDADRMANLASVFPVIFFLVAGLVCLTTMTRMVEEQRTQIGLMKALGYGRWAISAKYLSYGLLPSLAGSVLGLAVGHTVFPAMIYVSYQIMYEMPDIILSFYPEMSVWATLAAVACTTVSTLWACLATLADSPANLMRPRAPKPGKRVLLEHIPFIWRRMSFNWKITTRNLLRYQKRFWMTVMGIGGCTALIIAGFGLRESLTMTMGAQYDELFRYDAQITLSDGLLDSEWEEVRGYLDESGSVTAYSDIYAASVTAQTDAYSTSAYLEVFRPEETGEFIVLRDYQTGAGMTLPESGVFIDQKLSELLRVGVGDAITIDSDGMRQAMVAGIYEHYVAHFIYMSPAAYREIFGEPMEPNSVMLNLTDSSLETYERVTTGMLELNGVSAATRAVDTKDTYLHSMERVDFVVVVVILCAAALAIVVLYNLSNINMAERIRELATIKVLGFYDLEVTAYVYRENMLLTIVGILMGCLFGKYLHAWLIRSVEIDLMMFGRTTTWVCYALSAGLTMLFSGLVNAAGHRKMKGIDMVESLKSAE